MTKSTAFSDVNQGTTLATGMLPLTPLVIEGLAEFQGSFDRLCLRAGTAAIEAMLAADAEQLCGKRYERHGERQAYRWGLTASEISYHGGKASIRRSRVRKRGGAELELPSWKAILDADLLCRWAFNQMPVWRRASTPARCGCQTAILLAMLGAPPRSPRCRGA